MNKVSDYTRKINSFGKSLEAMLTEDFSSNTEVVEKIDGLLATIQYHILGAFLEKGSKH